MTDDNPASESDNSDSAQSTATSVPNPIPKARLDEEIGKRRTAEAELEKAADAILAEVPENLKVLIPEGLSPADRIAWFNKAKATGVFQGKADAKPEVPKTDTEKPKTTPQTGPDLSNAPAEAKVAAGYRS